MEEVLHVLLHSILDTALVLPAIFLVYILIELFEQKVGFFKNGKFLKSKFAPLYGSVAGVIPQCGISVMASKLYEKNLIKIGTLFSVFIATSDEALILLISSGDYIGFGMLIILKLVCAIIIGFLINLIVPKLNKEESNSDEIFEHNEVCAHHSKEHHEHEDEHALGKEKNFFQKYILVPLKHSLSTILFVLILNIVFGFIMHYVGEDNIAYFMSSTKYFQPFVVALIGLIPNCASSVIVTQLYISGGITFGSMFAGLVCNAGIGLAILFKNTQKTLRNILILIGLYLIGVALGIVITLF